MLTYRKLLYGIRIEVHSRLHKKAGPDEKYDITEKRQAMKTCLWDGRYCPLSDQEQSVLPKCTAKSARSSSL